MKFTYIIIALFLLNTSLLSQENSTNELSIQVGLSSSSIKDLRLSNRNFRSWSPKYAIGYVKSNDKRISSFRMQFSMMNSSDGGLLSLMTIRPEIYYSYQRKVKDGIWLGGFVDNNTLLNFPTNTSSVFNSNPISYTIAQSIGPRVSYLKSLDNNKIDLRTSAQVSLLSYVVQPAFGHPYPSQFLEEGKFNPTREGMAWPLIKSGKIATVNKFNSFRIELGFFYHINNSIKIGVDYNMNIQYANTRGKSTFISNHDIFLGATYIH